MSKKHYVKTFLETNLKRDNKCAVREADVYACLKSMAERLGLIPITWQQFHQLRKRLRLLADHHEGTIVLFGLRWRDDGGCRPDNARNYDLRLEDALRYLSKDGEDHAKLIRYAERVFAKRQ